MFILLYCADTVVDTASVGGSFVKLLLIGSIFCPISNSVDTVKFGGKTLSVC